MDFRTITAVLFAVALLAAGCVKKMASGFGSTAAPAVELVLVETRVKGGNEYLEFSPKGSSLKSNYIFRARAEQSDADVSSGS